MSYYAENHHSFQIFMTTAKKKVERLEYDDELSRYINAGVDVFVNLISAINTDPRFKFIEQDAYTLADYFVEAIKHYNDSEYSDFGYIFHAHLRPLAYKLSSLLDLFSSQLVIFERSNSRVIQVNDISDGNICDTNQIIDILDIQHLEFDYILINTKKYETIKSALKYINVPVSKILPNPSKKKSAIETFQPNYLFSLQKPNFSLISDECWGGFVYKQLGLPYNSPFMWLYILNKDYLKLLSNLDYYLSLKLEFIDFPELHHPVGMLGDITVFFNHYKSIEEAKGKWEKRLSKFNWDNIFVKMTVSQMDDALNFDQLPFANKICFSPTQFPIDSCVALPEWNDPNIRKHYEGFYQFLHRHSNHYFDYIEWLNGGTNYRRPLSMRFEE